MTKIKAAAVQISPVLYSRQGTVDKINQKITFRCATWPLPEPKGSQACPNRRSISQEPRRSPLLAKAKGVESGQGCA